MKLFKIIFFLALTNLFFPQTLLAEENNQFITIVNPVLFHQEIWGLKKYMITLMQKFGGERIKMVYD